MYQNDYTHENLYINSVPTIRQVTDVIQQKKNKKSTTDIKNEMLKRPGECMANFIYPLIDTIWREEKTPKEWNLGHITSLYKGKGDREQLSNHRGITVSSAIGTIIETIIDQRIEYTVPFTQAQGGGQRKMSTFDHLFILRAIVEISKKNKIPAFLTFFDVSKAYDNANNKDMLSIVWERGFTGKAWLILQSLTKDLTALVKTKYGPTRQFDMEIGGRQGSRITGRLFSKMMDLLLEESAELNLGFPITEEFDITFLLWVNDVLSCTIGEANQEKILKIVQEFAVKHRLQWGHHKCNVMRIGRHPKTSTNKTWTLGTTPIQETNKYKYLGDLISNNGKNMENINARKIKAQATVVNINSIASTEMLQMIESSVLVELHDKITIPGLIANCESWNLSKGETKEMEKIEYQAIRYLFDLPTHTPIPALIHSFGTPFTELRIEKRRLMYLHRILNRQDAHWTKKTLIQLNDLNIGWPKSINQTLHYMGLSTDFGIIKEFRRSQWKRIIDEKIEEKNKDRLIEECHKKVNGQKIRKSKSAHIVEELTHDDYTRKALPIIKYLTKYETKTLIIARFGMLECGTNFKGSMSSECSTCKRTDDEEHRLNYCERYQAKNCYANETKVPFNTVYSSDICSIKVILPLIQQIWNTNSAHGSMCT